MRNRVHVLKKRANGITWRVRVQMMTRLDPTRPNTTLYDSAPRRPTRLDSTRLDPSQPSSHSLRGSPSHFVVAFSRGRGRIGSLDCAANPTDQSETGCDGHNRMKDIRSQVS